MTLPCWKSRNVIARMDRARNVSVCVTDPSSRHAAMIARSLMQGRQNPMLTEEPEHCGVSIGVTVELLWKARRENARLRALLASRATSRNAQLENSPTVAPRVVEERDQ